MSPMAEKITMSSEGVLSVPDNPIIPYIEGDGTGVDIWPASQLIFDAAAKKHGKSIAWKEVLAGEKAFNETGDWLPEQTVTDFREHLIGRHTHGSRAIVARVGATSTLLADLESSDRQPGE